MKDLKRKTFLFVGFMGSGKSHLLYKLSSLRPRLLKGYSFYDLDAELEKKLGVTIGEWVDINGWESFREEEEKLLKEFVEKGSSVVACGGGSIHAENLDRIQGSANLIYLQGSFEACWERIKNDGKRPLVKKGVVYCQELFKRREQIYRQADFSLSEKHPLFDFLVMVAKVMG